MNKIGVSKNSKDNGPAAGGKGENWHKDGPNFREYTK
jgi:hypothetical protein